MRKRVLQKVVDNMICRTRKKPIKRPRLKSLFFIVLILLFSCSRNKREENILVRVGDRTISVEEFKQRAELTVRPFYCKDNSKESKRIILNSLITEKLLALNDTLSAELRQSQHFQAHIRGIKEQLMRRKFYDKYFYDKVSLQAEEIAHHYQMAGTSCEVHFFRLTDRKEAEQVRQHLQSEQDSLLLFNELVVERDIPVREVKWQDNDYAEIQNALLRNPLKPDQIVGPLEVPDGSYLLCRVVKWQHEPAVSPEEAKLRHQKVMNHLSNLKANQAWSEYQSELMAGKKLVFFSETLAKLLDIVAYQSFNQKESIRQNFNQADTSILNYINNEENLLTLPFFKIDGKVWTVNDFKTEIMSHPLVYVDRDISTKKEFKRQFLIAIDNLIRDHYLTEKAYQKNLHKHYDVLHESHMWSDALLARYAAKQYLKSLPEKENWQEIKRKYKHKYLSVYGDSLRKQYRNIIQVDMQKFKAINITGIDMVAVEPNVPYPLAVPQFPPYCQNGTLDYDDLIF